MGNLSNKQMIISITIFWAILLPLLYLLLFAPYSKRSPYILNNIVDITKEGATSWHEIEFNRKGNYYVQTVLIKSLI